MQWHYYFPYVSRSPRRSMKAPVVAASKVLSLPNAKRTSAHKNVWSFLLVAIPSKHSEPDVTRPPWQDFDGEVSNQP